MGTKIQSKTYFPGYCSSRDLNNNAGVGMWALYDEEKNLKNCQFYEPFLTSPAMEGYLGYEKEQLRQTILKHESMFRHQLQELHRLYRRQRDLMDQLDRREFHKRFLPAETSKSSLSSSQIPLRDAKNPLHVSDMPLVCLTFDRSSVSGADIIRSPLNFLEGNTTHSWDYDSPKPNWNKFPRKMFDLELPANVYMNNEGKQQEERFCGTTEMKSCPVERNNDATVNLSPGNGLNCNYSGEPLIAKLSSKRTCNFADLNEPILVEEASITDPVNNVGGTTCLEGGRQKQDISMSSNSGSLFFSEKFSKSCLLEKDGRTFLNNRHSKYDRNRNGQLTCNSKAGQTKCDEHACLGGISYNNSSTLFRSLPVEPKNADEPFKFSLSDQSKTSPERKRKIFGVEIPEANYNLSVDASYTPSFHTLNQQSNAIFSKLSVAHLGKASGALGHNVVSVQENSCLSTFTTISGRFPNSSIQFPQFSGDKMHISNNLTTIPPSGSNLSNQNPFSFGSDSEKKQLQGYLDLNHFSVTTEKFQSEMVVQPNSAPSDIEEAQCNGKQIKKKEMFYQMNLDSLQKHSQHFFDKTNTKGLFKNFASPTCALESENQKVDNDNPQSNRKIMGFPIVGVPHISEDLMSPISPSKSMHHSSKFDGDGTWKELAHFTESVGKPEVKDLVVENKLNNYFSGLRQQIDLNLSLNEEESPVAPFVPKAIVKIATTEIDLEIPAVLESDMDASTEEDHLQKKNKMPTNVSITDSSEAHEELARVAAEAMVDISSTRLDVVESTCQSPEASASDCLQWFAEVISSQVVSTALNAACDVREESIPEGMDYFEFMTLELKDTKEETYFYKPLSLDNQNDEVKIANSVPRRPRRGQARRGRQRKDFQRDVLPGLVSLSRLEVTEDLQTIEEMFKASGGTWQSSLSQRKAARNGRGRRRSGGLAPSVAATAVCLPQVQQPIYGELGFDNKNLTTWGKKTRRLPRQRCSTPKFLVLKVLEC